MYLFSVLVFFSGSFVRYIHVPYSLSSYTVNQGLLVYYRCAAITATNSRTFHHPREKPHAHYQSLPGTSQRWGPLISSLSLWTCPFWTPHLSGITHRGAFAAASITGRRGLQVHITSLQRVSAPPGEGRILCRCLDGLPSVRPFVRQRAFGWLLLHGR